MNENLQNNFLGEVYSEIVDGFSIITFKKAELYVKHHSLRDSFCYLSRYNQYVKDAENMGLRPEADVVKDAINNGWWSKGNEEKISLLKVTNRNLHKTQQKLVLESQKASIDSSIEKNEFILASLLKERSSIVGYTAEQYANSKYEEFILEKSIFLDPEFKQSFFENLDDYDEIDEGELYEIKISYNSTNQKLSLKNIKLLAASGFMQNLSFSCEESWCFWGKPIHKCTKNQNDLFLYSKIYRNVIKSNAEVGKPIHEEILSSPEKFVAFTEKKSLGSNDKKRAKGAQNTVSSYVGATNDDLKNLGVKVEKLGGKSLLQMARENGGVMEKNDYLGVREKS